MGPIAFLHLVVRHLTGVCVLFGWGCVREGSGLLGRVRGVSAYRASVALFLSSGLRACARRRFCLSSLFGPPGLYRQVLTLEVAGDRSRPFIGASSCAFQQSQQALFHQWCHFCPLAVCLCVSPSVSHFVCLAVEDSPAHFWFHML